ncbi:type IV pilus biogenesis/stability protein PilW [Psychromonas sp. RZ22]|uniref:type IV pilus biogenesis/stability protein PilW n=1 Tax=Psychromonas algarum TaxID=2555643 RepID=UPI001067DFD1|nr:type IV pilus biogenesis/stability protein PilW [Psychromonas sp. RZ22]TEW54900.1 type IV pilus biogenesis/stability protein PilW [Psychromonas sp. RZ22]
MRFIFIVLLSLFFISACVSSETSQTTTNNPSSEKMAFDPKAAANTRIQLALLYLEQRQMQQAKENLDKALEYQPKSAKVYRIFAYYYQKVNEDEKADEFYKKAISLNRKSGDTYHNYGTFLCAKGDYKEAEEAFLSAVALPNYTRVASTYENAAVCAEEAKSNKKAIYYYQYALSHSPNSNYLNLDLARLNIDEKNYDAAKLNLFSFQRASPQTAESLWQWVRLSYATGKKASLNKYSKQLLGEFPESEQALNYLNNEHYE